MSDDDMIRRGDALALPYRLSPSLDASDGYYVSVDAILAIPAAQADYDARIRSALTVSPHDPAKVQALVEQVKNTLSAYDQWADCASGTHEDTIAAAALFSRITRLRAALAAMKEGK